MFIMTSFTVRMKRAIRWVDRALSFTEKLLGLVFDCTIATAKRVADRVILNRAFAVRLTTGANAISALLIACAIAPWAWGLRLMLLAFTVRKFVLVFALSVAYVGLLPRAMCHVKAAFGLVASTEVTPNTCAPVSVVDMYRDFVADAQTRESESMK